MNENMYPLDLGADNQLTINYLHEKLNFRSTPITRTPANSNRFSSPFRVRVTGVLLYLFLFCFLVFSIIQRAAGIFNFSNSYISKCGTFYKSKGHHQLFITGFNSNCTKEESE